ncbi:MAG: YihY/virulence factor BrkB family protein [bacterium]
MYEPAVDFLNSFFEDGIVFFSEWRKLPEFIGKVLKHFWHSFLEKGLLLKAAALSYTTVLCILPLLAVTFTVSSFIIARMDPAQTDQLIDTVIVRLVPQVQLLNKTETEDLKVNTPGPAMPTREQLREQVKEMMNQLGSGGVGLVGIGFFIFLAISLLVAMEHIFNDIWKVRSGRPIIIKIAMYWSVLTLGTFLLITAITMTGRWQSTAVFQRLQKLPYFTRLFQFITPFVLFWIALTFIYMALPNKRVRLLPAFIGAIFGGSLLQFNNILNALYIFNVAMVRRLYGGLGILPIFLLGLYVSWLFVLAGGQLTHSIETIYEERKT